MQTDIPASGDYPAEDDKVYSILQTITVEGPSAQNRALLAEADQIVASTKF